MQNFTYTTDSMSYTFCLHFNYGEKCLARALILGTVTMIAFYDLYKQPCTEELTSSTITLFKESFAMDYQAD